MNRKTCRRRTVPSKEFLPETNDACLSFSVSLFSENDSVLKHHPIIIPAFYLSVCPHKVLL